MKIFFDARFIRTDFHDGISRYSTELGDAVAKLDEEITFIICRDEQKKFLPHASKFIKIHEPTSWKEPGTSLLLNKHKPDVVFSPMQTLGPSGKKFKLVLTIHDLIYYKYRKPPTHLNPAIRLGWLLYHATYGPQRVVLSGADMIATVSETSKQEIMDAKLTKRPVFVVPNAPNNLRQFIKDVGTKKAPTNLVYMGSFMPYKNVEALVEGMAGLPGHTLHLCSRITPKRKAQLKKLASEGGGEVIFHGGISDEKYAKLLADNALCVSASQAEGFGIPIAEAATLGVPAVLSDMPIFHEVAEDGALYFNSEDPKDFAKKVIEASELKTYQKLSKKAASSVGRFSWDKSAKTLLNELKKLA